MNVADMVGEGTSPLHSRGSAHLYIPRVVAGSPRRLQGSRPNLHRVKVLALGLAIAG
jgi:hypothetical protein